MFLRYELSCLICKALWPMCFFMCYRNKCDWLIDCLNTLLISVIFLPCAISSSLLFTAGRSINVLSDSSELQITYVFLAPPHHSLSLSLLDYETVNWLSTKLTSSICQKVLSLSETWISCRQYSDSFSLLYLIFSHTSHTTGWGWGNRFTQY